MPVEANRAKSAQLRAQKEAGIDETGQRTHPPLPDEVMAGLQASSNLSAETGHPGPGIKPCLATLLESTLIKGEFPNRNQAAVAIASELRRIGLTFGEASKRLGQLDGHGMVPFIHHHVGIVQKAP